MFVIYLDNILNYKYLESGVLFINLAAAIDRGFA